MALAAIEMDFYISISGIVTFNSADELREVVKAIPLERLLLKLTHHGLRQFLIEVNKTSQVTW